LGGPNSPQRKALGRIGIKISPFPFILGKRNPKKTQVLIPWVTQFISFGNLGFQEGDGQRKGAYHLIGPGNYFPQNSLPLRPGWPPFPFKAQPGGKKEG